MPFGLRKKPKKDLYWVINKDTGKKFSKEAMPKEKAEAQMRALYANVPDAKEGGVRKPSSERQKEEGRKAYGRIALRVAIQQAEVANRILREQEEQKEEQLLRDAMPSKLNPDAKPFQPKPKGGMILKGLPQKMERFRKADPFVDVFPSPYNPVIEPSIKGGLYRPIRDYAVPSLQGEGYLGDMWDAASNKVGELKKEFSDKGAAILTGTNYVGPWNRLDDEYLRTHPPTDIIDEGAMKHDLEYSRIAKLRKTGTPKEEIDRLIRESDEAFLNNIRMNWRANPRASILGYAGIKGKNVAEDVVGLDKNLFVGEGHLKGCGKAAKKRVMLLKKLHGSGFFGDLWDSGKQFVGKVVERVKQTGESIVNVFQGKAPRLDFPPSVRRLLQAYGNRPIVRMFVRRDPIQSALDTALNFISIGSWSSLKDKYGYDKFYHLQLEVVVRVSDSDDTNARFVLQKNEVIDVSQAQPTSPKTEMVEVPMSEGHTMLSLLNNAKQIMGEKFYYYSAFHNNCQDFVSALLNGSGLMNSSLEAFVKQPIDQLVQSIPITDRIARGITDLGGVFNVGLEGKGGLHPSEAFAAQLKRLGVSPSVYLEEAKKKADALGLAGNMLGFSNDDRHKLQMPNVSGKMIKFGAVGLGDYILYTLQKDPEAEEHRKSYLARATKIKGNWAKDPYSANSLAIGVLW